MENEKYLLISMEDERSKKLAEAISNKTCKKIVNALAEINEISENDIAKKLNLPVNTIEYNLKKLVEAGLVEKTKNFFWSAKGKKIPMYKLSKKFIVISPKSTSSNALKKILPVALLSAVGALLIKTYYSMKTPVIDFAAKDSGKIMSEPARASVETSVQEAVPSLIYGFQNYWLFFLIGALSALLIFLILNWRKLR